MAAPRRRPFTPRPTGARFRGCRFRGARKLHVPEAAEAKAPRAQVSGARVSKVSGRNAQTNAGAKGNPSNPRVADWIRFAPNACAFNSISKDRKARRETRGKARRSAGRRWIWTHEKKSARRRSVGRAVREKRRRPFSAKKGLASIDGRHSGARAPPLAPATHRPGSTRFHTARRPVKKNMRDSVVGLSAVGGPSAVRRRRAPRARGRRAAREALGQMGVGAMGGGCRYNMSV